MTNPAFFVDGYTERLFLNKICPGKIVKILNCNGHNVALEAIAKRIVTLINLLNNRNYPIVIIIDREDRKEHINKIESELRKEILKLGCKELIHVTVADRMIENWMLADIENFKEYIDKPNMQTKKSYEGTKGSSEIKKVYPKYHKTTDGVNLLNSLNPLRVYENCLGFTKLVNNIKNVDCKWLKNIK